MPLEQLAIAQDAGLGFTLSGLTDGFVTQMAAVQLVAAYGNTRPLALNGSQFTYESKLYF